ncbi:MAG: hypothetical protein ACOYBY_03630 [Dermatophilaceae bacterium]
MSEPVDVTVWLVCGYAVFLLGAAHALDRAARHTATSSAARRTGGFRYHPDHDAWRCPQDQWLWPHSVDPEQRVMRYRGSPLVCNACPVKADCTTSEHGREVRRSIDPWPSSEAERFHRGIACCLAVIAVLWPAATAATGRTALEAGLLCATALLVGLGSWPLWSHVRRTPAGFPEQVPQQTLDELADGQSQADAKEDRRRTTYRSDRRTDRHTDEPDEAVDRPLASALEAPQRPAGWSRIGRTP